ncbi:oxidoreductase C-terminal domain-containing protein [Streptomyces sp. NPDC002143]
MAHWPHPLLTKSARIEHWTNAGEHAAIVAAGITGTSAPRPQAPYVWSDQYGHRIQIVGRPSEGSLAMFRGDLNEPPMVALYGYDDGVVAGALVLDDPRTLMTCRKAVARRATVEELLRTLPNTAPAGR